MGLRRFEPALHLDSAVYISDHRSIAATYVSDFGYFAAFSNADGSKMTDVINDAKFRTFDPL